jgi:glycosyltransferase involved in cell wall biosynthesis
MSISAHVISPVAGFGNSLDLDLVGSLLEENGINVTRYPVVKREQSARLGRVLRRVLSFRGRFDVNIFLAPIFPEWLPLARKNVLIPNAEGFPQRLHKWLPRIDLVLAKTRLTERVFRQLGCRTEYVGFMSPDQLDEQIPREPSKFFHACSSQHKGTKRLLEVWKAHPEWPELVTVINNNDTIPPDFQAANIRAIRQRLPNEDVRKLQNSIRFHICCSEAEGFGHYIMEAMSCRAVTLTTNGAPMNELIQPGRGILVDCLDDPAPMGLSHRYLFKPESLEEQVERVRKLDLAAIGQIGASARAYFLESNRVFRERFPDIIRAL